MPLETCPISIRTALTTVIATLALLVAVAWTAPQDASAAASPRTTTKATSSGKRVTLRIDIVAPASTKLSKLSITLPSRLSMNRDAFRSSKRVGRFVSITVDGSRIAARCARRRSARRLDLSRCSIDARTVRISLRRGSLTATSRFRARRPGRTTVRATVTPDVPPTPPTVAPSVSITTAPATVMVASAKLEFSVGGTPPVSCTYNNNGGASAAITSGDNVALINGANHIVVTCTSAFGATASDSIDLTAEIAPQVAITTPVQNANVTRPALVTYTVDGSSSIPAGTTCSVNGDASTDTSESIILALGGGTIEVECVNAHGSDQAQVAVTVGVQASISNLESNVYMTTGPVVTLTFTTGGNAPVSCDYVNSLGGSGPIESGDDDIPLQLGDNVLTVTCSNGFGAPASASVIVDRGVNVGVTVSDPATDVISTTAETYNVIYTVTGTQPITCEVRNFGDYGPVVLGNPVQLAMGLNYIEIWCRNDYGPVQTVPLWITRNAP